MVFPGRVKFMRRIITGFRPAVLLALTVSGVAQTTPLDVGGKLRFHAESVYSPLALAGSAAYAGLLQGLDAPEEWGQGSKAYGKRVASTVGYTAIHASLAFGLDSALHQDPRYLRSLDTGFWRRSAHALHHTIMTRTDSGGQTLAIWRVGSAYGAAFLSNQWYPDRLNTVSLGLEQGSLQLGFDFAGNLASEFWPDIKRRILRRNH
jgi:hypothetical protein